MYLLDFVNKIIRQILLILTLLKKLKLLRHSIIVYTVYQWQNTYIYPQCLAFITDHVANMEYLREPSHGQTCHYNNIGVNKKKCNVLT